MSLEANKALARVWFDEVMNNRDLSAIDDAYAEDYQYAGPQGSVPPGLEEARRIAAHLIETVPDRVSTVEVQVAEGDTVVTRWTSRGTPTGELLGKPPTGEPVVVSGITISRIENGRIAADWEIVSVQPDV